MHPAPKKTKKYIYFIGIDISKHKLDCVLYQEKKFISHTVMANEKAAILEFIVRLKEVPSFKMSKAVFCMENTGIYGNHLLNILVKLKADIVQEHPLRIKKSMGISHGKDDKLDAMRIADYAWKNRTELKLWAPRRPIIIELADLMAYRNRLSNVSGILKTPQKEKMAFISKTAHKKLANIYEGSMAAITKDFLGIEEQMKSLISLDPYLQRLLEVITSVPFIGFITAVNIIICTNEYKDITSPKKFACYAGVAPFPKESGMITRRKRVSPMANKKMKSLLHICAMGAGTRNEEFKIYYNRKVAEGKHKISVINAIRYKLILRVFACLKQDRLFTKNYQRHEVTAEKEDALPQGDRDQ
jgi:transposase